MNDGVRTKKAGQRERQVSTPQRQNLKKWMPPCCCFAFGAWQQSSALEELMTLQLYSPP